MSTLIGLPAAAAGLPGASFNDRKIDVDGLAAQLAQQPVDSRRFPFTAALLSGVTEIAGIADQAIEHLELDGKCGPLPNAAYSRMELRMLARSARQSLRPHVRTLVGVSPIPVGMSPEDFYRSRFD